MRVFLLLAFLSGCTMGVAEEVTPIEILQHTHPTKTIPVVHIDPVYDYCRVGSCDTGWHCCYNHLATGWDYVCAKVCDSERYENGEL